MALPDIPRPRTLFNIKGIDVLGFIAGPEQFYGLDSLHAAAGFHPAKSPMAYMRDIRGFAFIKELANSLRVEPSSLYYKRGNEIWVTKLIAMDYAGWISTEFQILVYRLSEGAARQVVAALSAPDREVIREIGKDRRRECMGIVHDLIQDPPGRDKGFKYAATTDAVYLAAFGMTARQLRESLGLGKKAPIRDHLAPWQLILLSNVESFVAVKFCELGIRSIEEARPLIKTIVEPLRIAAESVRQIGRSA